MASVLIIIVYVSEKDEFCINVYPVKINFKVEIN